MSAWLLFVDESGDFSDADDDALVGGWVVRAYDTDQLRATLRGRLDRAHPHVPYPPHASSLNVAVGHAAACEISGPPKTPEHRAIATLAAWPLAALTRCPLPQMTAYRLSVEAREVPSVPVLRAIDNWLARADRPAWLQLAKIRDEDEGRRLQVHRALASNVGATQSFVVGAFERGGQRLRDERARYLALLGACLERAVALLADPEAASPPFLCIYSATRGFGRHARDGSLVSAEVRQAFDRARAAVGPKAASMQAAVRRPVDYDAAVHPGIVIADMVVNRLRRSARGAIEWSTLRDATLLTTAFPAEAIAGCLTPAGLLPTVGADGCTRDAIASALAGHRVGTSDAQIDAERPRWVGEQAMRWMAAARPGDR